MTIDLVRVRDNVAAAMEDIVRMFKPGVKITVLVRAPGFPDRDFMMTDDQPDEVMAMLERRKAAGADDGKPLGLQAAVETPPPPVDRSATELSGGGPITPEHLELKPNGQQKGYFVRPVRDAYRHEKCGQITTMSKDLAETYARDPHFYSGTFCSTCRSHFPVGETGEFTWYEMDGREGPKVGT
jgi:hypothetical protein